ncbi:MAG: phosphoribosylamine--glycine ligase, partial [Acidobacteria bacterium]|nr:phosphoribosylamine--glycine ligase [Acidobacteriota bacterium]
MRVMIIGSGGREHAIAWKLSTSPGVQKIYVAPGNGGTGLIGQNIDLDVTEVVPLADLARRLDVSLVVVGPELPLALGIVDELRSLGVPVLGPTRMAAQVETSKAFAKDLMRRYAIPTAPFEVVTHMSEVPPALARVGLPCVLKADGLAGGKGTFIVSEEAEALRIAEDLLEKRVLGDAGRTLVIEQLLTGVEVSFQVLTDGFHVLPLATSQDYKRAFDDDQGPNTGGMGAYSPSVYMTPDLHQRIMTEIVKPTLRALDQEGRTFTGILYTGLMLTREGPRVLEFNCRFGDPEVQTLLPRMETHFLEVVDAAVRGELDRVQVRWSREACVCVVLASQGYPGRYEKGRVIMGLADAQALPGVFVFHAGTRRVMTEEDGQSVEQWLTHGGRVLNVCALGKTLRQARERAYEAV